MPRAHDTRPHIHDRYERVFAPPMLFALNVAVILAASLSGGGRAFYEQGFIHVPVVLFTMLVGTRIIGRSVLFEAPLRRFLWWTSVGLSLQLLAFAVHFLYRITSVTWTVDSAFGIIISVQLASLLGFAFATFNVLDSYGKLREALPWVVTSAFVGAIAFCAALATVLGSLSNVPPTLYMGLAAASGLAVAVPLRSVERLIPPLRDFAMYMTAVAVFLAVSAAVNTVQLVAGSNEALVRHATYLSHFSYFAATSFLFLGLSRVGKFSARG